MTSNKKSAKKIKIITIHFGTNHGSVLQAFALSNYIRSLGHDAQIIDYVPERYRVWNSLILKKRAKYPLPVIMAYYPLALVKSMRLRNLFKNFLKCNLNMTRNYSKSDELKKNPPNADIYITGSDQVWNDDYNGAGELSYFLDFVPDDAKRIAYAASFGKEATEQEYLCKIKPLLNKFDAISVRESDAVGILDQLKLNSVHVVDPVFLLDKEQWISFENTPEVKEPYTLVYVLDGKYDELLDYAEKIKEKTGNKIYVVSFGKKKDARIDKQFHMANPKDFVGLVHNAAAVCTNSFHGTAFSVIFRKKFITIGKPKYNSRMLSLLNKLSLEKHFVPTGSDLNPDAIQEILQSADIENIDISLQSWVSESKVFIEEQLDK